MKSRKLHSPPPPHGPNSPQGTRDFSLSRLHDYSHLDKPHLVGLTYTSDKPDAEVSTYTTHNPHKRSHNSSERAAADPCVKPCGRWDRQEVITRHYFLFAQQLNSGLGRLIVED